MIFRQHLPDDWYNDFCGLLICIVTDIDNPKIKIIIKQEDPPFDLLEESDEPMYDRETITCIGYMSFSSLRHTTLLTSSYNIISFTIKNLGYTNSESTYVGAELIPRKSKSDEVQTTTFSEFYDGNFEGAESNTFRIQQCDSESCIKMSWSPCNKRYQ